jgi:hypothetical protein
LTFYAPPSDLWTRAQPLVRGTLGVERGVETRAVVEVKSVGTLPTWLGDTLDRAKARPSRFSKFVAAAEVVLGKV